jgi:hypothetical protein
MPSAIHDVHDGQHDGDLNQNADHGCENSAGLKPEDADGRPSVLDVYPPINSVTNYCQDQPLA